MSAMRPTVGEGRLMCREAGGVRRKVSGMCREVDGVRRRCASAVCVGKPTERVYYASREMVTGTRAQLASSSPGPRLEDVQARAPAVSVGLSRVGVTGVAEAIRIREELFLARLECYVDLDSFQKGAHMSRFEEVVNEAIGEVVLGESPFRAETLAQQIAELVRERQGAERAEVRIEARYPEHKPAPVSGIQTQEIYTLYGRAVALQSGTRRMIGGAAQGITACPR